MKIALVHDWLQEYAGSERVFEQIIACYPDADLYAVVDFMPDERRGFLRGKAVRTSFIQHLPFARRAFRQYIGLMPLAIEQLDFTGYDLVISDCHAVSKGVLTGPDTLHVSYVHSPIRYAWDLQHQYLRQAGLDRGVRGIYARLLMARLRRWDLQTGNRVDAFIANSSYIARRIAKTYRREAVVVAPPIDVERFVPGGVRGDTYLVASRQVPYKRIDLIAAAFAAMPQRRLVVVGDGSEHARVRAAARGAANVVFLPTTPQGELIRRMQQARAFVFAAEEDFGIVLAEALACGTPVIAYGKGGARDIVVPGTGVLFEAQTVESIAAAVDAFEAAADHFTVEACRTAALRFAPDRFRDGLRAVVDAALAARGGPIGS